MVSFRTRVFPSYCCLLSSWRLRSVGHLLGLVHAGSAASAASDEAPGTAPSPMHRDGTNNKREVYQATNDQSRFLNKNEARASFRTSANVLPHCNIRLCSYLLPHVYVSIRYDTLRTLHHGILPASISSLVKQVTDEICRSGSKEAASIGLASVRTHRCQQECWRRRSKCTLCETQSTPGMFSVDIDRLLSSRQHYNSTNRVVIGLG